MKARTNEYADCTKARSDLLTSVLVVWAAAYLCHLCVEAYAESSVLADLSKADVDPHCFGILSESR